MRDTENFLICKLKPNLLIGNKMTFSLADTNIVYINLIDDSKVVIIDNIETHPIKGKRYKLRGCKEWFEENCFEYIKHYNKNTISIYSEIIKELNILYPDTIFEEVMKDGYKIILYNNYKLEWDEDFEKIMVDLAINHLTENELNHFTYICDYLNQIGLKGEDINERYRDYIL